MKFRFLTKINFKKKSTIFFMAFWAVLIIVGLFVLDYGSEHKFGFDIFASENRDTVGTGSSNSYNYSHSAEDVVDIDVRWQSGKVELKHTDSDEFRITETSSKELGHGNRLIIENEDGVLQIKWDEQTGMRELIRGQYDKNLVVEVPADFMPDRLTISTVYGEVAISDIDAYKVKIVSTTADVLLENSKTEELTVRVDSGLISLTDVMAENMKLVSNSGDIMAENSTGHTLKLDSSTGNISFKGSFAKLTGASSQGDIELATDILPDQIDVGSVSGDVKLSIPDDSYLPASLKSVSGEIMTDFEELNADEFIAPEKDEDSEDKDDEEESFLNIRTTSGDIELMKGGKSQKLVEIFPEEEEEE